MTERPTLEEIAANTDSAELRRMAGHSFQQWAAILARILLPEDAWRQLLGAAIQAAGVGYAPDEVADMLRQAANGLETGQFKPSIGSQWP